MKTLATKVAEPHAKPEADFLGVARSASGRRWVERLSPAAELTATAIAQQCDLPEMLGRVLAARGADAGNAASFLNPTMRDFLPDPASLQDMEKAAGRFADAIGAKEPMAVFGDYDVDGAASVALIERFLQAHGQSAEIYIPDRLTEGYGPSEAAMGDLAQAGAKLIITVDCGIGAHAAIDAATAKGADVVVLDHHQADETLPAAYAVVDPNREDDLSGQGHLAAAGVVFLFLVATVRHLRSRGFYDGHLEPDLLALLDLVALATICDVVPLKGVNRAFVAQGLKIMRLRHKPGLRALCDVARLEQAPTGYTLGFVLGPRINAGGRTGFSALGAKLLITDDDVEARAIADKLEALNTERKAIEQRLVEKASARAEAMLAEDPDCPVFCLAGEGWHKGLLGLAASRITERFRRPALVIGWDGQGEGTGSARSVPGLDLGRAIRDAVEAGVILRGGGHAMAAGFGLRQDQLGAFEAFLKESFGGAFASLEQGPRLSFDGAMSAAGANLELMGLLEQAGPYGVAYPSPRFAFPHHRLIRVRLIKQSHIRMTIAAPDGVRIEACAFRAAETPLGDLLLQSEGLSLHLAGHLRHKSWQGRESVELIVEDAAKAI